MLINHDDAKNTVNKIVEHLLMYTEKHNITHFVVGMSGGLDSAVVAVLGSLCRPKIRTVGLLMPCSRSDHEGPFKNAMIIAKRFDIATIIADFEQMDFGAHLDHITHRLNEIGLKSSMKTQKIACGNLKARTRMAYGTYLNSNLIENSVVLSTDNYSEYLQGFWTIHGDIGELAPIQHIFKGLELPIIAEVLGIPHEIIDQAPSDGLDIAGNDEQQLGGTYQDIDTILCNLIKNGVINPEGTYLDERHKDEVSELGKKVLTRYKNTIWKRKGQHSLKRIDIGLSKI